MSDIATIIEGIRKEALGGIEDDYTYDDTLRFGKMLDYANQLTVATTVVTERGQPSQNILDDAAENDEDEEVPQWWWVGHEDGKWSVHRGNSFLGSYVKASYDTDRGWCFNAGVYCVRSEAEQVAITAWAEAGFSKAPKAPPAPKQIHATWYGILRNGLSLTHAKDVSYYSERQVAEQRCWGDTRVVEIQATVREVDDE